MRSGRSLGRKVLAKTIAQWSRGNCKNAFKIWKDYLRKGAKAKSLIAHSLFSRLQFRKERDAFVTWRKNLHRDAEMKNKLVQSVEGEKQAENQEMVE